jgi:hypothetical protein
MLVKKQAVDEEMERIILLPKELLKLEIEMKFNKK